MSAPKARWTTFRVPKHAPNEAHLSGLYCLAAAASWRHRFDAPKRPTMDSILKTMKAALPAEVPKSGLNEKLIRKVVDAYDLRMYRPNVGGITDYDWPADWIWLAAVDGLDVPRVKSPPQGRRHVLVLGLPDDQARLLVADPHPDTPDKYKVPIEQFEKAWKAGAKGKAKPWAVAVESMW